MSPAAARPGAAHLRVRVDLQVRAALRDLARHRQMSLSQLLRTLIARELGHEALAAGSMPDESTIREMAILIAVELGLKLQQLSLPGGAVQSRELLEAAARSAMERLDMVEASLEMGARL